MRWGAPGYPATLNPCKKEPHPLRYGLNDTYKRLQQAEKYFLTVSGMGRMNTLLITAKP